MNHQPTVGQIIWHDLLTTDIATALNFYAELLGWHYQIEHTSDFVWRPGEADYPLILVDGAAHGGLVEVDPKTTSRWIAYVRVADVDAVTAEASSLGVTVERAPFDVPGVGRSAMIRDHYGAIICPTTPTHTFPPPVGTFLRDELNTVGIEAAALFYAQVFGWQMRDAEEIPPRQRSMNSYSTPSGSIELVARSLNKSNTAAWIPYFGTRDLGSALFKAQLLGAHPTLGNVGKQSTAKFALLTDPTGAIFGLLSRT
jgi:predicted enzyme related to lactoylglutathione lyase